MTTEDSKKLEKYTEDAALKGIKNMNIHDLITYRNLLRQSLNELRLKVFFNLIGIPGFAGIAIKSGLLAFNAYQIGDKTQLIATGAASIISGGLAVFCANEITFNSIEKENTKYQVLHVEKIAKKKLEKKPKK